MSPDDIERRLSKLEGKVEIVDELLHEMRKDLKDLLENQRKMPSRICRRTKRYVNNAIEECQKKNASKLQPPSTPKDESLAFQLMLKKLAAMGILLGSLLGGILYGVVGTTGKGKAPTPKVAQPK